MPYSSLAEFVTALNEPPKSRQGRPPRDPRPAGCTQCRRRPRFRNNVPVNCECDTPPHPLAWLALMPPDQVLTGDQRRRCREIVDAELSERK